MTKTIHVNLERRSYEILAGHGLIEETDVILGKWNMGQKWVMVSQSGPAKRVGNKVVDLLKSSGFNIYSILLPDGEEAKSLSVVEKVYDKLIELECDRSTTLIALGGGVVGDAAGFVAATFMRGIPYVQIPTTLLSMVDSSIGGKTGVNLKHGKNLVGAIHQPLLVVTDISVLDSLPDREKISGLGEIFKYGAISDRKFYTFLTDNLDKLLSGDRKILERAVNTSCAIKAEIVIQDEFEAGLRRILNFGHTVGHAIEKCGKFNKFRHGEAVIIGMKVAGLISHSRGLITATDLEKFLSPLDRLPVPTIRELNVENIIRAIKQDKKIQSGVLHYILLDGLGNAVTDTKVTGEDIRKAWEKL